MPIKKLFHALASIGRHCILHFSLMRLYLRPINLNQCQQSKYYVLLYKSLARENAGYGSFWWIAGRENSVLSQTIVPVPVMRQVITLQNTT